MAIRNLQVNLVWLGYSGKIGGFNFLEETEEEIAENPIVFCEDTIGEDGTVYGALMLSYNFITIVSWKREKLVNGVRIKKGIREIMTPTSYSCSMMLYLTMVI